METYGYDSYDLKELWESDLDPTVQEDYCGSDTADIVYGDWGGTGGRSGTKTVSVGGGSTLLGVVLHDRLMTDAALGTGSSGTTFPIKTEHSYSLASDGDSLPDSPISHNKMDADIEDECFPAISMNTASGREQNTNGSCDTVATEVNVKDEPMSEPDSPNSSCPASPATSTTQLHEYQIELDPMLGGSTQKTVKHSIVLPARSSLFTSQQHRIVMPKINIKVEPGTSGFSLPPTPPSCSSSEDSEDNAPSSQPASPGRPQRTPARLLLAPHASTRQPIHTPLISSQPKGSTGTLMLTEEEKRTLLAEGYPVPTRLPLTKAEEKSLKKIRRKIKNKISAQESRRKKKEYMDQLERKVELLVSENSDYRKKIESLEDSNSNLMNQLAKLQAIVARTHPQALSRNNK